MIRAEEGRVRASARVETLRMVRKSWKACSWNEVLLKGNMAGDCEIARLKGAGPFRPP